MGGVFMKKTVKILCLLMALCFGIFFASVVLDKRQLSNSVIRMHVVADSDSQRDQAVKLKVKDAVVSYLASHMTEVEDIAEAKAYLDSNIDVLLEVARDTLTAEGVDDPVSISLGRESFPIRIYDTFTLPSGVYHSLRINIGEAAGRNWWCVVFPTLCMSAGNGDDVAVSAFSDTLSETIHDPDEYEVRFLLLDWLGTLENFFFSR